ncbi:DedA family protein [Skermania piniformis]|uniref:DedA family protein n=1 Tax=Skermania pinensis TaxID=39122 RepID=A0ABX8S8X9_9ACTN|nr:DedA family protein [Skermania piniformis]QXQ14318.1 DedA family protein [Skermania piniformis]
MADLMDRLLNLDPLLIFLIVGLIVFAEDAIFLGFVLPGETAAVLGGVATGQDRLPLWLMCAVVVGAAIAGDSVGYEVGRHVGPRVLQLRVLDRRRAQIDRAQDLLRRRGGGAVFLGRFVAFFRAVMPALAGVSRMRYPVFLAYNAAGGLVWGITFVLIGHLAARSYRAVESEVGRGAAIAVAIVVVCAIVVWRIRKRRGERGTAQRADAQGETDRGGSVD